METATTFNEKLRDYRMADDVPTSLVAALSAPLGGVHDTIKLERIRKLDCGFSNVINLKRAALALEENWCDLNSCVCFNSEHAVNQCPSKHSCKSCEKRHNTMLHSDPPPETIKIIAQQHKKIKCY